MALADRYKMLRPIMVRYAKTVAFSATGPIRQRLSIFQQRTAQIRHLQVER